MAEIIDTSKNNENFTGIKMPAIINFYDFTGIKRFDHDYYRKLQDEEDKKYEEKMKKYNLYLKDIAKMKKYTIHHILIFLIPSSFFLTLFGILGLLDTLVFLIGGFVIPLIIDVVHSIISEIQLDKFMSEYKTDCPEKVDILPQKKNEYLFSILNLIKNKYLPKFRILDVFEYEKLFFSNEGCALVSVESGRIILYGKNNIKNVLLEHKHIGSSSYGSSYSYGGMDKESELIFHVHRNISIAGGSHSDTYEEIEHENESIEHYEWHLDILTDFMEYPKLSFIFDDNSKGVEEAKVIYGIFAK
jgi:hypothetical protein